MFKTHNNSINVQQKNRGQFIVHQLFPQILIPNSNLLLHFLSQNSLDLVFYFVRDKYKKPE